jgi:hypothetical protein
VARGRNNRALPISNRGTLLSVAAVLLVATLIAHPAANAQVHRQLTQELTSSGQFQARFIEDRDHISVIELAGDYSRVLDGQTNHEPRTLVAPAFFLDHDDDYDFLIIISNFEFDTTDPDGGGDVLAFHIGVQNQASGIGLEPFDNTPFYGSDGRLQGYIDMAALTRYETDPLDPGFELVLGTMAHEVMHQWCCFVDYELPDSSISEALRGKDGSHWSYLLDTDASLMYGHDWRDNADGTFLAADARRFFGPIDLYLAGFFSAEEVQPFFAIENPDIDKTQLPDEGTTVTGARQDVVLDQIIASEGPRFPAAGDAQKDYRAAVVYLIRPGDEVTNAQVAALTRIRNAFQTRFSILTGGRATIQVFPQVRLDVEPSAPDPVEGGEIRLSDASIQDALDWLRAEQRPEGFWEDTAGTRLRDTTVTLQALATLDPTFVGGPLALDWLLDQASINHDAVARRASAVTSLGYEAGSDRNQLLASQNPDGGWGLGVGFRSDALDTALAVLALVGDAAAQLALTQAADFLVASQNTDGGWSGFAGGPSRTRVTTTVLRALAAIERQTPVAEAALDWLAARQNADGGFGDSPSTTHDTADVIRTVILLDALPRIRGGEAADYLLARQTIEGSWDGSTFATALVVDAVQRAIFPNWSFLGPVEAQPAAPRDGERVELTLTITNDGSTIAPAGVLRIFDGDPDVGGAVIGSDINLPSLAPARSAVVTTLWDTFDQAGSHTLTAVIDPDDLLTELSELDNRASIDIEVQAAPVEADLEVRQTDITISPAQPDRLPTTLGVSVQARNLGRTDVAAAQVELWLGTPESGELLDTQTALLPQRSTTVVNFSYVLTTPGTSSFTVRLDPADTISEADETNNRAAVSISTLPTVDLEVLETDIQLLSGGAFLGEDVVFSVTLHNRGTIAAPDTEVRYAIFDGGSEIELRRNPLQLDAGESLTQTVTWRVDRIGALALIVEVDPDNSAPEADESNNTAALPFTATEIDQVDFTVDFADFTVVPDPALEGQALTLSAVVRNTGVVGANGVEVAFYDGNPDECGSLI